MPAVQVKLAETAVPLRLRSGQALHCARFAPLRSGWRY